MRATAQPTCSMAHWQAVAASALDSLNRRGGFWLLVLADWAAERDVSGDTAFVLRQPSIEALLQLGFVRGEQKT
jgi:hypothetical protein